MLTGRQASIEPFPAHCRTRQRMTSRIPDSLFFLITFIARKSLELFFFVLLSLACRHDDYGCDVGAIDGSMDGGYSKNGKE